MLFFYVWQPFSGAREARERYAVTGRQPIPRHPLSGATELRSNTPFPGWGVSPSADGGNVAPPRRWGKKGGTPTVSHPLRKLPFSLLGYLGATERKRSYLEVGPKKERQYRYQLIGRKAPFLSLGHAQAVNGLRQYLRKTRAICRDNAAATRKT